MYRCRTCPRMIERGTFCPACEARRGEQQLAVMRAAGRAARVLAPIVATGAFALYLFNRIRRIVQHTNQRLQSIDRRMRTLEQALYRMRTRFGRFVPFVGPSRHIHRN